MNDSFLEDLDLIPNEQKEKKKTPRDAERNITRRRSQPSPIQTSLESDPLNILLAKQRSKEKTVSLATKVTRRRSDDTKVIVSSDTKKSTDIETKLESLKTKTPEKRTKQFENRLKPLENIVNTEVRKSKLESKERPRWSAGSNRESSRISDASSKENSRPSDSSRESIETKRKERLRTGGDEKTDKFEVAMLNSVKEIVSTYTKNESAKILRAMQELYINSQANMIKMMIQQTDDIASATSSKKESSRQHSIVEENARLKNDIILLESRNEELRRALEENERTKEENVQLKLRCKQLVKDNARYKKSHS